MRLSEIEEVCTSQRAVLDAQEHGLERHILQNLPDIKTHALVICGIRRCGKSTLLHQFVRKLTHPFFYLNFDDIRLASFNNDDYTLLNKVISDSNARLLFFDEIQSAQKWELYIRQKLDEGFQVVLTGSNASLLSRDLGSRLTGRHISKELFPFSYKEFCVFNNYEACKESLSDYLEKGGFPEYLKTGNIDILTQLQSDIIFRDIAVRYNIRDTASLRQLFVYLMSKASQLSSPSKLTGVSTVKSPTTVLEYISFFESSYLIYILPCFSYSLKAQSLAPKKIYVSDTGLIKSGAVSFSKNYGALLENFIYNSIRRISKDVYYYHSKNGKECDFIVKMHEKTFCIQVCWELTSDNQDREINGLLDAMEFFNLEEGTILTYNSEDIILVNGKKIDVIPAWKQIILSDSPSENQNVKL